MVAAAGYTPVYKGKFHCNKPANGSTWVPSDVNQYGFTRWDPPDAGGNQDLPEEGGGIYDNDGRFMNSQGTPEAGTEGAVQYLSSTAAQSQPFFMVVSLVNPHDVLFYPKTYASGGYDDPGCRARSRCRGRRTRTSPPSRPCRSSSCGCSTPPGRSRPGR